MKAKIFITLKDGVLDPQGKAVEGALKKLGFSGVGEVRVGKIITLNLNGTDKTNAKIQIEQMCKKLLANPVIENFSFEILS
jgi:phosphoribosylformylglycinamidine synthase